MVTMSGLGNIVDVKASKIDDEALSEPWSRCLTDEPATSTFTTDASNLALVTQDITRHLIELQYGKLLMFHAAALCHPVSGASYAFIAPSGTGKTTLMRTLCTDWGYLTDETAAIEPETLTILPYQKPLSLRLDGHSYKQEVSPDELGLLPPHAAPRLQGLFVLSRSAKHSGLSVSRMGLFDAINRITPEISALARLPRPLHLLAEVIERIGGIQELCYSEAESVRQWLDTEMKSHG